MTTPLPISPGGIVRRSVQFLADHFADAFRIGLAWIIVVGAARLAATYAFLGWDLMEDPGQGLATADGMARANAFAPISLILMVMDGLVAASIALAWHRLILTNVPPSGVFPPIDRAAIRYFCRGAGTFFLSGMIAALPLVAGFAIAIAAGWKADPEQVAEVSSTFWFGIIIYLPLSIIAGRLVLAFPSLATGSDIKLSQSWTMTDGQTWRIALCLLAACLVLVLPQIVLGAVVADGNASVAAWTMVTAIRALISPLQIAFVAIVMTFIYLSITEGPGVEVGPAADELPIQNS